LNAAAIGSLGNGNPILTELKKILILQLDFQRVSEWG